MRMPMPTAKPTCPLVFGGQLLHAGSTPKSLRQRVSAGPLRAYLRGFTYVVYFSVYACACSDEQLSSHAYVC